MDKTSDEKWAADMKAAIAKARAVLAKSGGEG